MEALQEALINGIIGVLVVVVGIFFSGIRDFIREKAFEVRAKTDERDFLIIQNLARSAVEAVEQKLWNADNAVKFQDAVDRLVTDLNARGIQITGTQIDTVIESAVKEMKGTSKVIDEVITPAIKLSKNGIEIQGEKIDLDEADK